MYISPTYPAADSSFSWAWSECQAAFMPDAVHVVTSWAEANVILSSASAAEPGPYTSTRTPYCRRIQDVCGTGHPAQKIVFMKGTQVGGTQTALNVVGYYIDHAPCPIMFVQKTVDAVKRVSKQRVATMIEASPALTAKVGSARSRDSGNTMLQKDFLGGTLVLAGANSSVGLRSMPARVLIFDECDTYERNIEGEGDPVKLAERRSTTFGHRRKAFYNSTPTIKGRSRIESEYEASTMELYHVPCPHCGHHQPLVFARLRWTWGQPGTAEYQCEDCGAMIGEHHKSWMLEEQSDARPDGARWVARHPERDVLGFHLNSLYSPLGWLSWREIAQEFEEADGELKAGKPEKMITFVNTMLAETWEDKGEAPDWQALYDRREQWPVGSVPKGALFLTAGVDVQIDRLEVQVWGWGEYLESWLVEHRVIMGDVSAPEMWNDLAAYIAGRQWQHETGHRLGLEIVMVDSGAFTAEVYKFVRSQDGARVLASKGQADGRNVSWRGGDMDDSKGKNRSIGGRKIFLVATTTIKKEFYRQLKLARPTVESGAPFPPGYVHLPLHVGEDGCKQLVSEVFDAKSNSFTVAQGQRNEWLDCRVYARAAAYWAGVDFMGPDDWQSLRDQYGGPTPAEGAKAPERHRRDEPPKPKGGGFVGGGGKNWFGR